MVRHQCRRQRLGIADHHGDVVEVVREVLRDSRFPAERLEIEITESVLLADEKRANDQCAACRRSA